jgi:histidine triad (HIT) family protein
MLIRLIIRLARTRPGRFLVGWIFAHMSQLLPLDRLAETGTLVAFRHPQPAYPFHALIVPKKQVASLESLDPAESAFLTDLYSTVQALVKRFDLGTGGYRLIVNGGKFQDFPQLHFHLISDHQITKGI